MKNVLFISFAFLIISCSSKDKYDVSRYYDLKEQDALLTSIITYIFIAPPYTLMKDRFKPQHRSFYSSQTPKFSIKKFYKSEGGTCFFLVLRPGFNLGEKRAVGGSFKMKGNFQLSGFREVFVTPTLTENEALTKGAFLFDEMVKGEIEKDLKMQSYVQWPNEASYYDTTSYEWKLKEEFTQ
jgi:hypothetical protein